MSDYRKMFDGLPALRRDYQDLDRLAMIMSGRGKFTDKVLPAWRKFLQRVLDYLFGKPVQIPSGYTYLGQFIIHDISNTERSNRHHRRDLPWENDGDPDYWRTVRNLREPDFNLETVYGHWRPNNPGETPRSDLLDQSSPLPFLRVGKSAPSGGPGSMASLEFPCDLVRTNKNPEAVIVDPRNDENLVLAQTLLAFIKFHNALVVKLSRKEEYKNPDGSYKKEKIFNKARELNIRYYQTIILTDFLPRIVRQKCLNQVIRDLNTGSMFYQPVAESFIPVEFSVAAFRFGHSMILPRYNFNVFRSKDPASEDDESATLRDLQLFTGFGGMPDLPSGWIIDWRFFYEMGSGTPNTAAPIDTILPETLMKLRPRIKNYSSGRASSLAALDFFRARQFFIASGQDIARRMKIKPLSSRTIANMIWDKPIKRSDVTSDADILKIKKALVAAFSDSTPLWFYILAEAENQRDKKLGPVGGRIVAETVTQLIYNSEHSVLRCKWQSGDDDLLIGGERFDMPELLKTIARTRKDMPNEAYPLWKYFDEVNPLGDGALS
ncbi:MAG: peroxidase family protein [Pyrinomonadaceae bacterium]